MGQQNCGHGGKRSFGRVVASAGDRMAQMMIMRMWDCGGKSTLQRDMAGQGSQGVPL